jgi:hypothetical protein
MELHVGEVLFWGAKENSYSALNKNPFKFNSSGETDHLEDEELDKFFEPGLLFDVLDNCW